MSGDERPYRELSNRAIFCAAVVLIVVGVGLAVVLLVVFGGGEHSAQLDAIKTAGTIVVGTGGAAALWLAARRQRTTEIALNQKHADQQAAERAHALQERVAATSECDAMSRRITESYGRAVDQLGSDKAPVRLGGLYALRRLAQDNPGQRQTIVDVICAYLRMSAAGEVSAQELQVRMTAQRILAHHLRDGDEFWPDIDLDLTGAVLTRFSFTGCRVRSADFTDARFTGATDFDDATFFSPVKFTGADFADGVGFHKTLFHGTAGFAKATFGGYSYFGRASFAEAASFEHAVFARVGFRKVDFRAAAIFAFARFTGDVEFDETKFGELAAFLDTRFLANVRFCGVEFADEHPFNCIDDLSQRCWVRLGAEEHDRRWPTGWAVVPSTAKPRGESGGEWGRLTLNPK
ncbi:pentapeptide repeat-containing protein [Amycolatopsis sp. CA-230715]|uniref:pentapeptide repeat-containing protein n=1 Tax=Amycolatopsis sp. CA-230715 TaxID=2745196 RepID=UPI001C01F5BA|nr:pentapeptide repeat-containing protein [Amycolatopsis sp. CA-230715]